MFTAQSHDPFFVTRLRHEHPQLHPNHIGLLRLAHAASFDDLDGIDRELEVLAARRREILGRLHRYRQRLWPGMAGRHHRKFCRDEENPLPPATVDAYPLWGGELRQTAVAILRRHGSITLRELHGLIHRYGYVVDSNRPVQRLADAVAYEVRHGRLERVTRGVYGPVPRGADSDRGGPSPEPRLPQPLPWRPPASGVGDPVVVDGAIDPSVREDPERWSGSAWPASAQAGGDWCAGSPDPFVGELAEDLDATVSAIRQRFADLYAERLGPPPRRFDPRRPPANLSWARTYPARTPTPPTPPAPAEPMGDDSSTNRSPGAAAGHPGADGGGGGPEQWWMWGADGPSGPE